MRYDEKVETRYDVVSIIHSAKRKYLNDSVNDAQKQPLGELLC